MKELNTESRTKDFEPTKGGVLAASSGPSPFSLRRFCGSWRSASLHFSPELRTGAICFLLQAVGSPAALLPFMRAEIKRLLSTALGRGERYGLKVHVLQGGKCSRRIQMSAYPLDQLRHFAVNSANEHGVHYSLLDAAKCDCRRPC
jgi:hypothetical protein